MIELDKLNEGHPVRVVSAFTAWVMALIVLFFHRGHPWHKRDMSFESFNRGASNLCLSMGLIIYIHVMIINPVIILIIGYR